MENNNIFGLQYSECDTIVSNLNTAISRAQTDLEYINYAYLQASGCRSSAKDAIWSSLSGMKDIIDDISNFKESFSDYYKNVKNFDEKFFKSFGGTAVIIGETANVLAVPFGYGSTGKDGLAGTARDLFKTLSLDNCYIVEKDGYYIVKGTVAGRKGISALGGIKGTKYKVGSEKFIKSGLNKYLPKGSSIDDVASKFTSNISPNLKKGFEEFGGNTFKFKRGEKLGNTAKGLGYASIGVGVVGGIYENYQNGADAGKYAGDAVADTVSGLVGMAAGSAGAEIGFAIGTAIPVPVVGSVAGAALGFVGGYVGGVIADKLVNEVDIGGQPVSDWISYGVDTLVDGVVNETGKIWDSIKGIF